MDQEAVTRVGFSLNAVWNTWIVKPTTSIQIINKIVITDFFAQYSETCLKPIPV